MSRLPGKLAIDLAFPQILTPCLSAFQVATSPPSQMVLTLQGPHSKPDGTLAGHAVPSLWRFLANGCRAWLIIFSVLDAPLGPKV